MTSGTKYRAVAVVGIVQSLTSGRIHADVRLVVEGPEGCSLWGAGSPGLELEPQSDPAYLYELGDDCVGEIANDLERGGDTLDFTFNDLAQYWVGQDMESDRLLRGLGAN